MKRKSFSTSIRPQCPEGLTAVRLPGPEPRYVCVYGEPIHFSEQYQAQKRKYMDFFESNLYIHAIAGIKDYLDDVDIHQFFSEAKQDIDCDPNKTDAMRQEAIMELIRHIPRVARIFSDAKEHAYYRIPVCKDTWEHWQVVKDPNHPHLLGFQHTETLQYTPFAPERSPWTVKSGMRWNDWVVEHSIVPDIFHFRHVVTNETVFTVPPCCPFFNPHTNTDKFQLGLVVGPWVKLYSVAQQKAYFLNPTTNEYSFYPK